MWGTQVWFEIIIFISSEVKWALGNTAINKASGCDGNSRRTIQSPKGRYYHGVAFNMSANLEDPAVAVDWKRSLLIPIPKKGSTKECANHWIVALISHANSLVQFIHSVVSDSLPPHGLQHTRPPCPSPTPGACPNSCPSSRWCHPTISSSVVPFSSHLQSFPELGLFQMSQFFTSGGKVLEFQLQHQSFQWIFMTDFL